MIYYLIYLCLSIISIFNFSAPKKVIKVFYWSIFIVLLIFCGLRLNVGYDYDNYKAIFHDSYYNRNEFIEPLFLILLKGIQFFFNDYNFFLLIVAFLAIFIKFKFLIKYSIYPLISVLIYYSRIFLISDFGQIRQGLALGIILYSYIFILRKSKINFFLLVILATLIHTSAFIFIPIYFLSRKIYQRKVIIISIIFAFIFVFIDIKNILIQYLSDILPSAILGKLLFYSSTENELGITFSMILRLSLILYSIFFFWKRIKDDINFRVAFNIYYFGYLFYLIFNSLPQLGGRGSLYFQQFELLLFPFLIYYQKDIVLKIFFYIFLLIYAFWGILTVLSSVQYNSPFLFEPYQNLLNIF